MSRWLLRLMLGAALAVSAPAAAWAACDISLREVSNVHFSGARKYKVFEPAEAGQSVQFSVKHRNNEPPCAYFVTFSRGGASTYDRRMSHDGVALHYQLYDVPAKTHILRDLPDATNGDVLSGMFTSTGEQTHDLTYFVAIPPLQVVGPGNYRDDIVLTLYEGTLGNAVRRDSATVRITANVDSEVGVCLGCDAAFDPNAQAYEMNFGVLEEGETRATTVRARSNDGYTLIFSSDNRGVMRHVREKDFVPYVLTVNGVAADLSQKKVEVAQARGLTAVNGAPFAVEVRIGDIADAEAGDYRDNITITVKAY